MMPRQWTPEQRKELGEKQRQNWVRRKANRQYREQAELTWEDKQLIRCALAMASELGREDLRPKYRALRDRMKEEDEAREGQKERAAGTATDRPSSTTKEA